MKLTDYLFSSHVIAGCLRQLEEVRDTFAAVRRVLCTRLDYYVCNLNSSSGSATL